MNVLNLIRNKEIKARKLKEAQLQMAKSYTCYTIKK